jgi:hypothetical protein
VSDPEVPESEPTPTEEDGETLCKLVLERLPYGLASSTRATILRTVVAGAGPVVVSGRG